MFSCGDREFSFTGLNSVLHILIYVAFINALMVQENPNICYSNALTDIHEFFQRNAAPTPLQAPLAAPTIVWLFSQKPETCRCSAKFLFSSESCKHLLATYTSCVLDQPKGLNLRQLCPLSHEAKFHSTHSTRQTDSLEHHFFFSFRELVQPQYNRSWTAQ